MRLLSGNNDNNLQTIFHLSGTHLKKDEIGDNHSNSNEGEEDDCAHVRQDRLILVRTRGIGHGGAGAFTSAIIRKA
jgi:hypothetical protein